MIYQMKVTSNTEDFLVLEGEFGHWKKASFKNELQYVDKREETVGVSMEGGFDVPDVLYQDSCFFFSQQFKEKLDAFGVDYLFYKKIRVVSEELGVNETMYLVIVPRVDCLDLEEIPPSQLDWEFEDGMIPLMEVSDYSILPECLGRYQMFRILGVYDQNIYITEDLHEKIKNLSLEGTLFLPCDN